MNSQDFRSLQEAYMEVVENQQLKNTEFMKFKKISHRFDVYESIIPPTEAPRASPVPVLQVSYLLNQ